MIAVIVVPAFEPGDALIATVRGIRDRSTAPIVVVDDGSGLGFAHVFAAASKVSGVAVLAHGANYGKGRALRTGIEHAVALHPRAIGVVTADADGQHDAADIVGVADQLAERPRAVVLGTRRFTRDVPIGNRFGNACARACVRLITGRRITDTQTGLRAIPRAHLPALLSLQGARYDFEMEALLWACAAGAEIHARPIRTIYENVPSHFAALADSARIARVIARFALSAGARRRYAHSAADAPDEHALDGQVRADERQRPVDARIKAGADIDVHDV